MRRLLYTVAFFSLLLSSQLKAQNEGINWTLPVLDLNDTTLQVYDSLFNMVRFSCDTVSVTKRQVNFKTFFDDNNSSGITCISDTNGRLQFSSNGYSIWNKDFVPMANGDNLFGYSQSRPIHDNDFLKTLIVPYPNQYQKYYLFFVNGTKVFYAVVNMALNNGSGGIESKDSIDVGYKVSCLTAAKHLNEQDFWVITYGYEQPSLFAFQINTSGLNRSPIGSALNSLSFIVDCPKNITTHLSFSKDYSWLVLTRFCEGETYNILEFNRVNGTFTPKYRFYASAISTRNYNLNYTCFSANKQVLYATKAFPYLAIGGIPYDSSTLLVQVDLSNITPSDTNLSAKVTELARYTFPANGTRQRSTALKLGPDGHLYVLCFNKLSRIRYPDQPGLACEYDPNFLIMPYGAYYTLPNVVTRGKDTATIHVKAYIGPDTVVCSDKGFLLQSSFPADSFFWNTGSTAPSLSPDQTGQYILTAKSQDCAAQDTVNITVNESPRHVSFTDTSLCKSLSGSITLTASAADTISWLPGNINAQQLEVYDTGTYYLEMRNDNGCKTDDTIHVSEECVFHLYIPNAFNPNSSSPINRVWKPVCDATTQYELIILNRSSGRVFKTNDPNQGWDGTIHGNGLCSQGVYTYFLTLTTKLDGQKISKSGSITLLR